jgi:hypothetical protein
MSGQCQCGEVQYTVPYLPKEIANCHCTICQRLHKRPFVSFAKYNVCDIMIEGGGNIRSINSSERALRGYCQICNTILFMYYNDSENIWMNADTFNFDTSSIDHYNIYTDTAVVKI